MGEGNFFQHNRAFGKRETEKPKVGPKGELSGSERVNGVAQGGQPERSAVTS